MHFLIQIFLLLVPFCFEMIKGFLSFQTVAKVRGHSENITVFSQQIIGEGGKRLFKSLRFSSGVKRLAECVFIGHLVPLRCFVHT